MIDFPLTHEQQAASQSRAESTLVLAGAGTGKTRTLLGRVIELVLHRHVPADKILLLAFARQAALEMQERLAALSVHAEQLRSVEVRTFHGLGLMLQKKLSRRSFQLSPLTDDRKFEQYVRSQIIRRCWSDCRFRAHYFRWLTLSAAMRQRPANQFGQSYPTIRGDYAGSLAGLLVNNLLFELNIHSLPGVPLANIRDRQRLQQKRQGLKYYRCSFYLPLHKVAVFLNDCGKNPKNFPSGQAARSDGPGKQVRAQTPGGGLRQNQQNNLHRPPPDLPQTMIYLDDQACQHEVSCLYLEMQPDLDTTLEYFRSVLLEYRGNSTRLRLGKGSCCVDNQAQILAGYIRLYAQRSPCTSAKKLLGRHAAILGPVLLPLLRSYRNHLRRHNEIDYNSMLAGATKAVLEGKVQSPWRHVLVDECQDLSEPQYRLLTAIRSQQDRCDIFCVGDDWQSIYRFAGSDIRYVTDFEASFGKCEIYRLTLTHRFNLEMCLLSSGFILQNPHQSRKYLTAEEGRQRPISILGDITDIATILNDISRDNAILDCASKPDPATASVLILARFRHQLPGQATLNRLQRRFPYLNIQASTVHAVKGNEADYVIVTNCEAGEFGFPSEKNSDPITQLLLPAAELFAYAEERRLFYVALTRAKRQCYLLYDRKQPSVFIKELLRNKKALRTGLKGEWVAKGYCRSGKWLLRVANRRKRILKDFLGLTEKKNRVTRLSQ